MKRFYLRLRKRVLCSRHDEEGQGVVELTIAMSLLLLILIVSFEFAIIFATYIALLNSARAGARYASTQPGLLLHPAPISDTQYAMYCIAIQDEALAAGLDGSQLTIYPPETKYDGSGNPMIALGEPITTTLDYNVKTFTSGIGLPFFGRFGLPSTYRVTAKAAFPIGGQWRY
jgi:hypothetical protein